MNAKLPFMPGRPAKPRQEGITMMMDKGLSVAQVESFVESSGEFTDLVKFGFGTSLLAKELQKKIDVYKAGGVRPYFGGTLFEAFFVRGMVDDYRRYMDKFGIDLVEVSDGSVAMEQEEKLSSIESLAKDYTVLSEVGSKQQGVVLSPDSWIEMMQNELKAGSWKVIAEARESGTVGIYNADGSANVQLIEYIQSKLDTNDILWEAPSGKHQIWFIKMQGPNVNLGNIAPDIVVPLETLRLGVRGDTFLDYLPEDIQEKRRQVVLPTYVIDYQI
ncbi:MAG: phosphosulfolactate synthase [Bacteroidales bacterium]|nr:phosphosulfolactate synthase [Bacteroidales bacterium]